jgi:hypothetical protein
MQKGTSFVVLLRGERMRVIYEKQVDASRWITQRVKSSIYVDVDV